MACNRVCLPFSVSVRTTVIERAAVRLWSLQNCPESNEWHETCEICGSHSGSDENWNVPGYCDQSTGKTLPSFEEAYCFYRQNQALQEDLPSFKGKAPWSFETSVKMYQSTRCNDPEGLTVNKTYTFQHSKCFQGRSQNCEKRQLTSSCLSVLLTVRVEQLGSHWMELLEILYLSTFRKYVKIIQVSLKSDKDNAYFTWRPIYVYDHVRLISSQNEEYFRKKKL